MCGGISHLHNSCNPGEVSMISARTDTFCLPLLECLKVVVVKFFLLEDTLVEEQEVNCVKAEDDAIDVICSVLYLSLSLSGVYIKEV